MPKSALSGKSLTYKINKVKVTTETYKAIQQGTRIIAHQGGTRSGKTYSIIQLLIGLALKEKTHISIVSCAFPHLRRGALRDWMIQMENVGLYDEDSHRKSEETFYYPNGSMMEFFSVDNALKVRGPGRDILFINEANLIDKDTFMQLLLRTRKTVIIDYNPADEYHWIYDEVLTRDDCKFIQSTYRDNPFLPAEQIEEIERLKEIGGHYWQVYGLGEVGTKEGLIYPNHEVFTGEMPEAKVKGYGLDFGFSSDPTALIKVHTDNRANTWEQEVIYETGLTNSDLIAKMRALGVEKNVIIYADSAEPDRIEEIRRAGYKVKPVKKGAGSIKAGIDTLQTMKRHIHKNSTNLLKEIKSYSWMQDKDGKNTGNPVAFNDHAQDAVRYFMHMVKHNPTGSGRVFVRKQFF